MNPSSNQQLSRPAHRTWHQFLADYFIPPNTDGEETHKKIRDTKLRNDGYQQAAWEEDAEIAYNMDLRKAVKQDFSDLHGFIRCCCDDLAGHPVVLVQAERLVELQAEAEHVFRYVIVKLDEVVDVPYSIICVHERETNARASRMDNMLALRWFYERLPVKYKLRLKKVFIVNPSSALRSLMAVMCPFFTHGFWSKVNYVWHSDTLWEHIEPGKAKHFVKFFPLTDSKPESVTHKDQPVSV